MDAKDKRIAVLEKNSSNSSKPPSSDIVKPPKIKGETATKKSKRKRGAQKGHKQHLRKPFDANQIDNIVEFKLDACPACGGVLVATNKPPKVHQQVELVEKPFVVTEFRQARYWCEHCQCFHAAELPKEVEKAGLFGPKLISLTAYLKGRGHMSYKTLQDFFNDAASLKISKGFLAKQVRKVTDALEKPYEGLLDLLPDENHLHIDETGSKENGLKRWIWCFRAGRFTGFRVDPSRGSIVLENLLGMDYAGTISCDFGGAYRKFKRLASATIPQSSPGGKDAINLAERLWNWQAEYFRFIESNLPATNNLGELTIRKVVIDRKVTQRNPERLGQSLAGAVLECTDDLRTTGNERDVVPVFVYRIVSSWSRSSIAATRLNCPFSRYFSIVGAQCP